MDQRSGERSRYNELRSLARRIKSHPRENVAQIIALGNLLLRVKELVGHGEWLGWLDEHFPYSRTIARETIRAAKKLSNHQSAARSFGPSALRVIAKKRTSQKTLEKLLNQRFEPDGKPLGTNSVLLHMLGANAPNLADLSPEDEASEEERAYLQFIELTHKFDILHFSISTDPEVPGIHLTARSTVNGEHLSVSRSTIDRVLAAATGNESQRRCPKCKIVRSVEAFARATSYCRACERDRVKTFNAEKRRG